MTTLTTDRSSLTGLPHWETIPDDIPAAIREIKTAIRARIAARAAPSRRWSPRSRSSSAREVADIQATKERGEEVWPVIDYADIEAGTVSRRDAGPAASGAAARSSAGTSTATQAEQWDRDIVELRRLEPLLRATTPDRPTTSSAPCRPRRPSPRSTRSTGPAPRWRPGSIPRMATVQAFLNAQWTSEPRAGSWFDPEQRLALPRPDPPPAAGRRLRRPRHPPRPRHARPVDDRGLPAALPAPVRRRLRRVRPVGRRLPHRGGAVPGLDHVLGLPHLPGLDRAQRDAQRPGRAAHRADPQGDGLPDAAAAARRRARGRHVLGAAQPDLPGQREVARDPARGRLRHPERAARRLGLVALRHDPLRRAGHRPAGLGQRDLHPGRAVVRQERGVRRPWSARPSWPARARTTSRRRTTRPPGRTASSRSS